VLEIYFRLQSTFSRVKNKKFCVRNPFLFVDNFLKSHLSVSLSQTHTVIFLSLSPRHTQKDQCICAGNPFLSEEHILKCHHTHTYTDTFRSFAEKRFALVLVVVEVVLFHENLHLLQRSASVIIVLYWYHIILCHAVLLFILVSHYTISTILVLHYLYTEQNSCRSYGCILV
jgi:hypothetical protein